MNCSLQNNTRKWRLKFFMQVNTTNHIYPEGLGGVRYLSFGVHVGSHERPKQLKTQFVLYHCPDFTVCFTCVIDSPINRSRDVLVDSQNFIIYTSTPLVISWCFHSALKGGCLERKSCTRRM